MKQINKVILMGTLLVAVLGSSCKKSFYDINKDPNNAVISPPTWLLPRHCSTVPTEQELPFLS
jgi:hypothetical protein